MDFRKRGYQLIAGIDEAGRGALAGPVVAAAVILPLPFKADWQDDIRDSKQLTPARREHLYSRIREAAVAVGIGMVTHDVIDGHNIVIATRLAMRLAVADLTTAPHSLLIDYVRLTEIPLPQKSLIKGDQRCFSIACASIIAKVARDRLMTRLEQTYPGYELAVHKGYGTRGHLDKLRQHGPCPIHRRSFAPVREACRQ
jgi:ribonuclease HII